MYQFSVELLAVSDMLGGGYMKCLSPAALLVVVSTIAFHGAHASAEFFRTFCKHDEHNFRTLICGPQQYINIMNIVVAYTGSNSCGLSNDDNCPFHSYPKNKKWYGIVITDCVNKSQCDIDGTDAFNGKFSGCGEQKERDFVKLTYVCLDTPVPLTTGPTVTGDDNSLTATQSTTQSQLNGTSPDNNGTLDGGGSVTAAPGRNNVLDQSAMIAIIVTFSIIGVCIIVALVAIAIRCELWKRMKVDVNMDGVTSM